MLELFIGCKMNVPNGKDEYFNLEMEAESYPDKENIEELKDFLQCNYVDIIDEVVYCIDKTTADLIWGVSE